MSLTSRITWFKTTFGSKIAQKVAGTPLSVDFITAIALQETGYLWDKLITHHGGNVDKILEGCVGDTIDAPSRRAFPKNKAELLTIQHGAQMFAIGRAALQTLADIDATYRQVFLGNPNKFCRGYGILQYDLQHIKVNPAFFLQRQWTSFDVCLDRAVGELMHAVGKRGFTGRTSLTNFEAATVAIIYNTGRYQSARGLKQGHESGGRFYGEWIAYYLEKAQAVQVGGSQGVSADTGSGSTQMLSLGTFRVNARSGLRLREGPGSAFGIVRVLDNGTPLTVIGYGGPDNGWAIVDLEGDGVSDGAVFAAFLETAGAAETMRAPAMFAEEAGHVEEEFHVEYTAETEEGPESEEEEPATHAF